MKMFVHAKAKIAKADERNKMLCSTPNKAIEDRDVSGESQSRPVVW